MNFFAKKVILPLLKLVEDNQEYLCESDNLPQLAKLLFIVNKLWNAGSLSFGMYDNDSDSNYIKNDLSKIKIKEGVGIALFGKKELNQLRIDPETKKILIKYFKEF